MQKAIVTGASSGIGRATALRFSGSFDVAVVDGVLPRLASELRAPVLGEVRRVLRPGGRCLVIDSAPGALSALMHSSSGAVDHVSVLQAAGFKASRVLAERNGQIFAEAVNPSV